MAPSIKDFTKAGFKPSSLEILAQFHEPPVGSEVNPRTITPFLRALLEIDGTVTDFIKAYTMEPVRISKLGQGRLTLPEDVSPLEALAGDSVTTRQVLLWGVYSHRIYAYGSSLIVPDRLDPKTRAELEIEDKGLGRIMRERRMETFREIIWRYREYSKTLPEAIRPLARSGLVSRTYRVIFRDRPIMLINEKFPCGADPSPDHH